MKKVLFVLCSTLLLSSTTYAQIFCNTLALPQPQEMTNSKSMSDLRNSSQYYILKVYFHVLRDSYGYGGVSSQDVQNIFNLLYEDFDPYNIFFYWDYSVDYIDNSSLYLNPSNNIFNVNSHSNGIDIYLYPSNANISEGSSNGFGNGTEFYISGRHLCYDMTYCLLANTHVVSHEMGHILNLYHTHHGTLYESGGDYNQCAEYVNGSNSDVCGDYVEDTPADPGIGGNVNNVSCVWVNQGTIQDALGAYYNPDTHLIMSYTNPDCMEYFSPLQVVRMKNAIESFPVLLNTLLDLEISGPTIPEAPSVYSVANLPAGCSVAWSYSGNALTTATMTVNSPAQNQCTINNSSRQYICGTLTAIVSNNGVALDTLTKTIDTGVNFSGTYSQASYHYTNPNWYYHGTSATTFQSGDHFSLYKGPDITLTSNQFNGATITYLTGSVYGWSHNNNIVSFYFPYYANNPNSPAATTITGTYPNNYEVFQFSILGKKPIGIVHPIDKGGFSLTSTGNSYIISIGSGEMDSYIADDSWTLSVVNAITGLSKLSVTVSGPSYTFDTTGWESGVYVIQVTVGSQTFTQKISVK